MSDTKEKRLEKIIRLMESDDSIDAPGDSITWARNLFKTRQKQPSIVSRIVASLQTEIKPLTAVLGERSAGASLDRHLLFNAGEHAVDLRISAENSHVSVHGQVLGVGFAGSLVLLKGPDLEKAATLDEMSEFDLAYIPKGYYSLTFSTGDREIVIEEVDL